MNITTSIAGVKRKVIKKLAHLIYFEIEEIKRCEQSLKKVNKGCKENNFNSFVCRESHKIIGLENFQVGENVQIDDNAFINAEGGVEIGPNTHIGSNFVLSSVEKNAEGSMLPFDDQAIYKKVVIGKNVSIDMNVCIEPGTIIGDGCIIGMGTTVSGIVPPLSIVTSPKCIVIKQRDENHYKYLEEEGRYIGPKGQLNNWGNNKSLQNIGDKYLSRRSTSTLIDFKGKKAIQKVFLKTPDGKKAFETELKAYIIFRKYSWCPLLLETSENCIIIEYFNPETRLDLMKDIKQDVFGPIVWCLFEMFYEGYAHRDFHAKNIFVTKEGIKLIDFETIEVIDSKIDFLKSYDVTGAGLESPYLTGNMGILNNAPISISYIFKIKSVEEIKTFLESEFRRRLYNSSITFKTLRGGKERHSLKNPKIYSSFDLFHTKIDAKSSQRDTKKRFERFAINKQVIEGKSVLDIGSNIGATLLNLYKYNPSAMVGLEYDIDKVEISKKLARYNLINNVCFKTFDIETDHLNSGTFDIVFCLAVLEHLRDKAKLFDLLGKSCLDILFFEGNANSSTEYIVKSLKACGFTYIKYLGFSDDEGNRANNNRPLFVAKK